MGKANRPIVVRVRPGDDPKEAVRRAQANPNNQKRKSGRILIRLVSK